VHIQNNITLLQRRGWNVLLAHAYDELLTEEEHGIRTKDLMRMLEFDSKNEEYLKESLEALVSCKVRWNVLDKDHPIGNGASLRSWLMQQSIAGSVPIPIVHLCGNDSTIPPSMPG